MSGGDVIEGHGPDESQGEPLERLAPQGRPHVSAALIGRLATGLRREKAVDLALLRARML